MPVYNAIDYLPETIKSLQAQTYANLEIISIDDLSTDLTFEYMQKIAACDSRFFVKRRETKGGNAVKALEYSLPYCHGEYYFFMSHDDLMDVDFIEKCVNKAIETQADIVVPNLILYQGTPSKVKYGLYPVNDDYLQVIDGHKGFYLSLSWALHGNSFKSMKLVREIGVKAEYYNSCEFFGRKTYLYANKIVFCDTYFYYRQNNPNAITKKLNYFTIDVLTTDIMLYELLLENNYTRTERINRLWQLCGIYSSYKLLYRNTKFKSSDQKYIDDSFTLSKRKLLKYAIQENYYICVLRIFLNFIDQFILKIKSKKSKM